MTCTNRPSIRRLLSLLAVVVVALCGLVLPSTAQAEPLPHRPASVTSLKQVDGNLWEISVYSPSMDTEIPFQLIRPRQIAGAPTLYLLNGAGGGEDGSGWLVQTDALEFFADKRVNVLIPNRGLGSFYTDWLADDQRVGHPMWTTFLTQELPPVVDAALATDGRNAIAGLSMSATSALDLAIQAPGLYQSVASISGCAQTSTPPGQAAVRGIVYAMSGGDADNMWGPPESPLWIQHDPLVNAERLRGTALYLSSGDGRAGRYDTAQSQPPGAPPVENRIVVGGTIEAGARYCTEAMAQRLRELAIPATINLPATGTHSWLYFQDEMHRSWPTIDAGLTG